jgi:hypothetical protein
MKPVYILPPLLEDMAGLIFISYGNVSRCLGSDQNILKKVCAMIRTKQNVTSEILHLTTITGRVGRIHAQSQPDSCLERQVAD